MEMENWLLSALVLIIFPMSLCFLFHKKRGINREKEEKVGESSNQEQVSDDPPEEFEHEVFLSFRGVDTRTNFTDHLYSYLTDLRIHTFRDNEKLHVGEKIGTKLMEAIEQSKILIPIFSKGYASSEWCLMELTHMVKRVEIDDRVLMYPIFYDVTPSEVRNQKGTFKDAFDRHTKKFDKKTVDEWKEALRKVPEVKGWEKDKIADGHEAELVKRVTTKVLTELKKKHVKVTEHLVGMDQHEAELMQLLDLGCNDVKIVGIVGMGGIGKTTIAKFIYNKLCDGFSQRCSILENVREKVNQSVGLDDLKEQLMKDILKRPLDGVQMNRSTFKNTKALIVLDDAEDRFQLTGIIGERDWFGRGSRIIVTTRNRDTFIEQEEQEGEKIYEPREMNPDNALRLFCKHAFRRDFPREGYEDLSRKVVSKVAGLPLSLEVIGSLLSTKKREVWEETLKKLKKIMPKKIQERLQISYDMLDDGQKEIFLDIACHFIETAKDKMLAASYMWEDCGFFPVSGIEVLVTLSLVKIVEFGRFWMHDQLRDLGREIVRKKNRRLWSYEVALDVLTSKTGTKRVQTLTFGYYRPDCLSISNEEFKGLSCLRYLNLSTTSNLTGDFKDLLSELRWFRWHPKSQLTEITNFCLPKLVVLDLSDSSISDGWDDLIQIKMARNLQVLDLSNCVKLTKTPELSAFPKLERLNLRSCSNLVEISPSIRYLKCLTFLDLDNCVKCSEELFGTTSESLTTDLEPSLALKRKLPDFIWCLTSLVELGMRSLPVTELSEAIGNLTNLSFLGVDVTGIKKLPYAIGKLEKLEELYAYGCESLEELPETIGDLLSLRELVISFSKVERLPRAIGKLEKLECLNASYCKSLGELPENIGNLRNLIILRLQSTGIKKLPASIVMLQNLEKLNANYCKLLGELPDSIGNLRNLRFLKVYATAIKRLPAGIGLLQKLEVLDCSYSSLEGELPSGVWSLSALRELSLRHTKISSLLPADISCCSHLTTLDLGSCPDLRLPSLELKLPTSLEQLEIPLTKASLDSVVRLPGLLNLAFHQCDRTDLVEFPIDLSGLSHELEELNFYGFENFTSLPVKINNLPLMLFLSIGGGGGVTDNVTMRWSDECESPVLELDGCESLERLPDLSNAIKKIRIHNCPKLFDIDNLSVLTSLVQLDIKNCPSLESLPDFSALNRLKELNINRV